MLREYYDFILQEEGDVINIYHGSEDWHNGVITHVTFDEKSAEEWVNTEMMLKGAREKYKTAADTAGITYDTTLTDPYLQQVRDFVVPKVKAFDSSLTVEVVRDPTMLSGHFTDWVPADWHETSQPVTGILIKVGTMLGPPTWPTRFLALAIIPELVHWRKTGIPFQVGVYPKDPQDYIDSVWLAAEWGLLKEHRSVFYDEIVTGDAEGMSAHMVDEDTEGDFDEDQPEFGDLIARFEEEVIRYS